MTTFASATEVRSVGGGRYEVDLRPEFAILGTKPNGGYLLVCMARAALHAAAEAGSRHEHVVAAGAQYLASPDLGPAWIEVEVLRVGRTATQVRTRLGQGDGAPGVEAQLTLATLPAGSRPFWGEVEPAVLPPFDECQVPEVGPLQTGTTVAFDPATSFEVGPDGPRLSGGGEIRAWFRNDEGDTVDPLLALYAADVLPPATFGVVSTGWVPTLDLTVYVRALPEPGPLRLRFRAQVIQDGFADEVCEAWDAAGRLVFQSTQLAALRLPPT